MKTLSFIRHGKSSWADVSLSDIDRPLNNRGLTDCCLMAEQIGKAGYELQTLFCSPANRALSTAKLLLDSLANPDIQCVVDESLYTFSFAELRHWVEQIPEVHEDVVVIGHNPAITEFCNYIANAHIVNVPTCGYVRLKSEAANWNKLSNENTVVETFLFPKMFK